MGIERHIEELLYRYNCVVVPEFGAFLSQRKSAVIDSDSHIFYPPSKLISFNEQLVSNDGLLVSHIANVEELSYEDALNKTLEEAKAWKRKLRSSDRLTFSSIGELWLTQEGKIQFQPSFQVNYLTESFGLTSFASPPIEREVLKEEVVSLEEKIPFIITPETRKEWNFRPYLKYAAVLLLALSTGLTGFRFYDETKRNAEMARQEAQTQVSKSIQEATFFKSQPLELPALELKVKKINQGAKHHIIAGAFRIRENADKKVRQLTQKGFEARYIGVNRYGLHQVTYGSFQDSQEALEFLKEIKRTESRDAWMLSTK